MNLVTIQSEMLGWLNVILMALFCVETIARVARMAARAIRGGEKE